MAKTNILWSGLGRGLDGSDKYGIVAGKIDEERRKNAKGNKRKSGNTSLAIKS